MFLLFSFVLLLSQKIINSKELKPKTADMKQPLRVCYYTTWARYRPSPANMQPADIDPRLCSHVVVAFGTISSGKLALHHADDEMIIRDCTALKRINLDLKVLLAIGGWSFGSKSFQEICQSETSRNRFVRSATAFLKQWNLDGLDLDWEYPTAEDRKNFSLLITGLREAFNSEDRRFLLTAAVPATRNNMLGYDPKIVKKNFDFISIMSYDFAGPWDKRTGHNAPLYSYDELSLSTSAQIWHQMGIPKQKIVLGLASYGHIFNLKDPRQTGIGAVADGSIQGSFTRSDGFLAYFEACQFIAYNETVSVWEYDRRVPYAFLDGSWLSFDNILSVRYKVKWIKDNGYAGAMLWELGMDDFNGLFCGEEKLDTFPILFAINEGFDINISNYAMRYGNFEFPQAETLETTSAGDGEGFSEGGKCKFELPQKKDCFHFYKCAHGRMYELECPGGTVFNTEWSRCAWPFEVPECNKRQSTDPITTTGNADIN